MLADPPYQGAGVDALERRQTVTAQVVEEVLLAAMAGGTGREAAGDEALHPRPPRFGGQVAGAVVADVGLGHDDDLAAVGGIGEDLLLVAGHRGVEDDLAHRRARRGRAAAEDGAVFEQEEGFSWLVDSHGGAAGWCRRDHTAGSGSHTPAVASKHRSGYASAYENYGRDLRQLAGRSAPHHGGAQNDAPGPGGGRTAAGGQGGAGQPATAHAGCCLLGIAGVRSGR